MLCRAQTVATRICSSFPNAAESQPNRHRLLQEAAEDTEELIYPLITRMSADWMLQSLRPSAKSTERSAIELDP